MTEHYLFLSCAWLRIQIAGLLKDMVDGLRVSNPQTILLSTRIQQRLRIQFTEVRPVKKSCTYPKRPVPTDDIPQILEEPLLCRSSFFGLEIPLVSLCVPAFSVIDPREAWGVGTYRKSKMGSPVLVHP